MAASTVIETIARQWAAQAPATIRAAGRTFKRSRTIPSVYDNENNSITFTYAARKRRDEMIASAAKVTISYVRGTDTYDVVVVLVDGMTFDLRTLANATGVYADGLARVVEMVK